MDIGLRGHFAPKMLATEQLTLRNRTTSEMEIEPHGLSTVHGPGLPDSRDSQYPKFWEYWESRSPDSRDSQNPQNVEAIGSLGSLDSRTPNTLKIWDIGSLGSLGVWTPKTLNISGFGSPGVQSVDHCLMVTVLRSMGNWHKYSEKVSGKTNFCCWDCSLSLFCHSQFCKRPSHFLAPFPKNNVAIFVKRCGREIWGKCLTKVNYV